MQYKRKLKVSRTKFQISTTNRYVLSKKGYRYKYRKRNQLLSKKFMLGYIVLAIFSVYSTSVASVSFNTKESFINNETDDTDMIEIEYEIMPLKASLIWHPIQISSSTTSDDISILIDNADVDEFVLDEHEEIKSEEEIVIEEPEVVEVDLQELLIEQIGNSIIDLNGMYTLKRYNLPDKYYPGIDFSSFQPYMSYDCITNKSSGAYKVCNSENAYSDEHGFRRYRTSEDEFTIDDQDDYIVALGTYYKPKGETGSRYLITTTTGMYTVRIGDEKSDMHTDEMHMFSRHGNYAGLIEWIIDDKNLNKSIKRSGTVTQGPVIPLQGEITNIYRID